MKGFNDINYFQWRKEDFRYLDEMISGGPLVLDTWAIPFILVRGMNTGRRKVLIRDVSIEERHKVRSNGDTQPGPLIGRLQ